MRQRIVHWSSADNPFRQIYASILGSDNDRVIFSPSCGVLLWRTFHAYFDGLAFSFYDKV